jgi:hypothetical protein
MADANTNHQVVRPEYMLTTFDNPFDPFTEWDEWYMWDLNSGYHTPGLLARITHSSEEISDADQFDAIQNAIDEIVRENVSGMHRKIKRGDFEKLTPKG